jgi:ABC-type branched-subunit amino acid transport system ATPase component
VLSAGQISAHGTPEELKSSPVVEQLYFGAIPSEAANA